jgi:predicted phosphodiesterase
MQRLILGGIILTGLATAAVVSGQRDSARKTAFPKDDRNPVTHLRWNDDPQEFQFAIVSDRTGGHRPEVFSQAVEKLNLLQPSFVLSVGDLVEGSKKNDLLAAQWKEFDGFVARLQVPFFYVPGNHDVSLPESAQFWKEKLGRRYYHFVYHDVLFLVLNADDPPGSGGAIAKEQVAYARQVLKDNAAVRWTVVALHRPLWTASNGAKNGWREVEQTLAGRRYTVFVGHVHHYQKFVRNGMNYYQLATTGGSSLMRGMEQAEFDHVVWVTMKQDGPVLANLMLDSIQTEDLRPIKTVEPGSSTANRKPVYPVRGRAYFEGTPIPGARVTLLTKAGGTAKGSKAVGVVAADGSFDLSTYRANDGAPAGEYQVTVVWPGGSSTKGANLLPSRYASGETSGLRATIQARPNELLLELKK